MLISDKLLKALEMIEDITKSDFVSCEIFSDGSGHIIDDKAQVVFDWSDVTKLEDKITDYIKKGKENGLY